MKSKLYRLKLDLVTEINKRYPYVPINMAIVLLLRETPIMGAFKKDIDERFDKLEKRLKVVIGDF